MTPLATPEELSGYLQREIDRYSAEMALMGASGVIRGLCGWELSRITEVLTADGNGGTVIKLPTLKLNDVLSLTLDGVPLAPEVDYSWRVSGLIVSRQFCWPHGSRCVLAEVDHGYAPLPDDLRIVCCAIAGRMYANPEGLHSRTTGDSTRAFGKTVSDLEMRLISRYALT